MSYTDIDRPTVQPASVVAAVLINGGAVLAILFAGSTIVERTIDKPIQTQWFDNPKPVPDETRTTDEPRETKDSSFTRSKPQDDTKQQVTENDLTGGEVAAGSSSGEGAIIEPVQPRVDPVTPPAPILTGSRVDLRYASDLQPDYPQSMRRAEISGSVRVRVRIGRDGRVTEVQILSSTSEEFAEATKRQALRKWRFIPATRDGQAEESWREMTVKFEMPR